MALIRVGLWDFVHRELIILLSFSNNNNNVYFLGGFLLTLTEHSSFDM